MWRTRPERELRTWEPTRPGAEGLIRNGEAMGEPSQSAGSERNAAAPPARDRPAPRHIRRLRGLPAGRAVVGALLVTVAAVGVFATHLSATAEPGSRYLIATRTIEPGSRFVSIEELHEVVSSAPLDLGPALAARAIRVEQSEDLVARAVLSPLEPGDLLTRTAFGAEASGIGGATMSFPIARSSAVAGALHPGERIDVAATYGTTGETSTAFVVRGVPLLAVRGRDGEEIGTSDELSLTVALAGSDDVLALGHAVNTASIFVVRSTPESGSGRDPGMGQEPSGTDATQMPRHPAAPTEDGS